MKDEILKYLSKYTEITNELEHAITTSTFIESFEKGTILLKEGDISTKCYFVLKGCIRSYIIENGEEKTIDFYTEEQVVTPSNYGKSIPSNYYFECMENTIVNVGNPKLEKETFQKYPQLESLSLVIAEVIMTKNQESFANFKTSKPEERYLNMLKTRPDLIQRVPQHQIASYLGIKPESLSRIRKRIINKK
ncbi:Crp/Fnr family transcriptional regulator [Zobellia galactanivorans]|uniref:Crp/Fnr-type transcriptional regulator n=1 Tax=Zobellia galactanivorans (strain DSM 12802 / CCUG 47099 / CIP 106680 / NCIMB 13871 / Dsij) TaxID=63186 RepID=G0L049_ZOBGA|nr:Crp/Fnr family transcriptional regulator [Zobellia galactanivorans]CAZ97368.1 Crp/Fnr-type transcriptional regulator [Zobellia galactanivorans]